MRVPPTDLELNSMTFIKLRKYGYRLDFTLVNMCFPSIQVNAGKHSTCEAIKDINATGVVILHSKCTWHHKKLSSNCDLCQMNCGIPLSELVVFTHTIHVCNSKMASLINNCHLLWLVCAQLPSLQISVKLTHLACNFLTCNQPCWLSLKLTATLQIQKLCQS